MNSEKKPHKQLVVDTFNKQAETYLESYESDLPTGHSFTIRRQRVCELLAGCQGGKALDIGCGPGVMVEWFINQNYEFFGIDKSKEMISECNKRFGHLKSAHFSIGDMESLEFPTSVFDVVICMGVLEYIDRDEIAIKEIARVLKPQGIMIVTLPNKLSPYRWWDRVVYRKVVRFIKRVSGFEKEEIITHKEHAEGDYRELVAMHQLRVVDVVYYHFRILFAPLDRFWPRLAVWASKHLEFLCRGSLKWLGTGFIIKAVKE